MCSVCKTSNCHLLGTLRLFFLSLSLRNISLFSSGVIQGEETPLTPFSLVVHGNQQCLRTHVAIYPKQCHGNAMPRDHRYISSKTIWNKGFKASARYNLWI